MTVATRPLFTGAAAIQTRWETPELSATRDGVGGSNLMWPNAVYHDGFLWVAYIDDDGYPTVLRWDIEADSVTETVVGAFAAADTHSQPALLRLDDGSFLCVWTVHNEDIFRAISADGVTWGSQSNITSQLGTYTAGNGYTYPKLWQDSGGDVHIVVRKGGAFVLTTVNTMSTSTDGGDTWSAHDWFYDGEYSYIAQTGDRLDIVTRWNSSEDGKVCHAYLDSGDWHKSDGTVIAADPFDDGDMTQVATFTATHRVIAYDIAPGPVIVLLRWKVSDGSESKYQYARWTGSAWSVTDIVASGTTGVAGAGISLDKADPSVVYLVREVAGLGQVWRYETSDGGSTWASELIASSADDELSPMVPVGAPAWLPVAWFTGAQTSATDYAAGVSVRKRLTPPVRL